MLPHNFWKEVEKPMDYVQYGDSVDGAATTVVKFGEDHYIKATFDYIWEYLVTIYGLETTIRNGKEYIFDLEGSLAVLNYSISLDKIVITTPIYMMRHHISEEIFNIKLNSKISLKTTKDHGMLGFDGTGLFRETADNLEYIPGCSSLRYWNIDMMYSTRQEDNYISERQGYNSTFQVMHELVPIKIREIELEMYDGYVYDFEVPGTHNFIANDLLVHNTDSLYIALDVEKGMSTDDLVVKTDTISTAINDQIIYFTESFFLPKLGVDISHNGTFFKTELIADSIMFLDIKKNYAYRELADKGKIHDVPIVKYTGIPVVRNNIAKFTKDFIRSIVENIALNDTLTNAEMKKKLHITAKEYWDKLQKDCSEFNFDDIGIPCKWGSNYTKEPFQVTAMRTYNTISGEDVFAPSSSAINIPIKLLNQGTFASKIAKLKDRSEFCLRNTSVSNVSYLALPYNRDQQKIKELISSFGMTIDINEYWAILYNKVAKRIVDAVKNHV